jgi:HEAT repeat protein
MDVKGIIPTVVGFLEDSDQGVRSAAFSAIGKISKQRKTSFSLVHLLVLISIV